MAKSFAVWIEGEDYDTANLKMCIDELHINFWCTREPDINCIDLGIKFSCGKADVKSEDLKGYNLNIFIPFPINKDRIEDLSTRMESNSDLVSAIFNDHIRCTRNIKTKHVVYSLASKKNEYLALNTGLEFRDIDGRYDDRVMVSVNHDHAKITFKLSKCILSSSFIDGFNDEGDFVKNYVRLRLNELTSLELDALSHKTINSDRYLKPYKDELIVIDFRINELRVLPNDVKISLANSIACPSRYHLFIIRNETDEYQLSHSGQSYKKCRILEGETWQKYFEKDKFKKDQSSMIYHWEKKYEGKESRDDYRMTDFIAVAKFRQTESPGKTIIIYILVIIIISIVSCGLYDLIKSFFVDSNS